MSTTDVTRFAPEWLALREAADAAARAPELLEPLRLHLPGAAQERRPGAASAQRHHRVTPLVIRDLGCGTGSMGRWLAPRLGGRQHWILHDHDPRLLELASSRLPRRAADGSPVTVTTERGDVSRLTAERLMGTSLVTASALLDLLTREELDGLVAACAGAGCPALLALSVVGRVDLTPADPMDDEITDAFNAHQRREEHGRRLLGPDAVAAASVAFARQGMTVRVETSPWRLGSWTGEPAAGTPATPAAPAAPGTPGAAADPGVAGGGGVAPNGRLSRRLTAEWLRGWVGAACEQRPDLADRSGAYLRRRLEACEAGELRVAVHHSDVLALPGRTGGAP
ncbi:class I SAM-dependent methyltransferase [Streptomyces pacificus]|uniref:Class I SAM-dependent methyltransferase n=1 Tax=Streptomyces pacificus TaxID=2705029 RepID=A0A6A0AUQ2_9ACTN|nr:class I SAM-dependent methyltransferase [Streptomyces pacificus]GFH36398.1 class I SAM-dependent methyltransferase [Streptomyces pacificus]